MTGTILRLSAAASLLAMLAGCNSSNPSDSLAVNPPAAQAATAPVVQANCPPITVLDTNAVHQVYAGAKGDPSKLVYQASCRTPRAHAA